MSSYRPHPWVNNLNRVWSTSTLDWVVMTQPGAGGGGTSDATAANQVLGNASVASIDATLTDVWNGVSHTLGVQNDVLTICFDSSNQRLVVDGSQVTQPVKETAAATSTVVGVTSSASNVTLKASNPARRGLAIFNDADKTLYLKHGATATTADFTVKVLAGGFYELPMPCYSGVVDGIWATGPTGNALVTETS